MDFYAKVALVGGLLIYAPTVFHGIFFLAAHLWSESLAKETFLD